MNIARQISDTKQKLIDTINNSGLPASIIELIISGIYAEVKILTVKEYESGIGDDKNGIKTVEK